jgi:hypothetical protein
MNRAAASASNRASQFVRDALLQPDQVEDVVLAPKSGEAKAGVGKPDRPAHAHGDFGHGDFGHADR